ncbi:threonineeeee dehydratase [Sporothrix schenckii 1099-18]|uniref:Threonineeeee dehydratase n=1 Tax=Sporothrix schenckii 1099-18 TaxID=1397361 RepID=A0A0F2MIZ5_SPOSC|nr:threonineeeee dehydratase [Sporothrix schenckii 1099-18]KJR88830.1 threonineeeee dehydratase [Sporothrix schenckii 1099-18]
MADLSTCPPLTRASVVEAHNLIRPFVHRTPVLTNRTIDGIVSTPRTAEELQGTPWEGATPARPTLRIWFKCENMQRVGAFKARGAFHAVERLKREPGWEAGGGFAKGVATHSSGNHAQALALAARTAGLPAHIVMPAISAAPKVAATRGYGARVVFSGSTAAEREAVAAEVMAATGARLVPPYDHPDIILGQGTAGLELQEQVAAAKAQTTAASGTGAGPTALLYASATAPQRTTAPGGGLDAIMTPCGGGGLLAGTVLSAQGTGIRVFGAEPSLDGADDCARGLAQGKRIEAVQSLTIADGLRTPVGVHNWAVLTGDTPESQGQGVHGVYAVGEDQIRAALRLLLERLKIVVEPSSAVPLAVVLYNEEFRRRVETDAGADGWDLGIVLSGGNVSLEGFAKLFPEA